MRGPNPIGVFCTTYAFCPPRTDITPLATCWAKVLPEPGVNSGKGVVELIVQFPIVLDKSSEIHPAKHLVEIAGQSTVRHGNCRSSLRKRLVLCKVSDVGKSKGGPKER